MTAKQKWFLDRLLIPAGILPPAINYADLKYNEELRQKIGNVGFEYFYMLEQDPEKIYKSAIGGKIFAVHAPWPFFPHVAAKNPLIQLVVDKIVYGNNKLPTTFSEMAEKTFQFAKSVGAKIVVIHTFAFDNLSKNLEQIAQLQKTYQITATIEHEGPVFADPKTKSVKQTLGQYSWMSDPVQVSQKVSPIKICVDSCSLIGCRLPILETVKKVFAHTAHIHVADSIPDHDQAGEIKNYLIVDLVNYLFTKNYPGFILAEINGTSGFFENLIAQIYGGTSILRVPMLKKFAIQNAQAHIQNSCNFILKNI